MADFEESRDVTGTPESVWALVSDPRRLADWVLDGRLELGPRARAVSGSPVNPMDMTTTPAAGSSPTPAPCGCPGTARITAATKGS